MDEPRGDLLADAALAGEQDGAVDIGDPAQQRLDLAHRLGRTEYAADRNARNHQLAEALAADLAARSALNPGFRIQRGLRRAPAIDQDSNDGGDGAGGGASGGLLL